MLGPLLLALLLATPSLAQEPEREAWPDGSPRLECERRAGPGGELVRHGEFISWHPGGERESQGSYADGRRVGPWKFWHDNGQLAGEGAFRAGLRNSRWRYWDSEGQLDRARSGTFRAQIEDYPSGARRVGGELEGKHKGGTWTFQAEDGTVLARGGYARDRRHGLWTFHWPADGGLRYEGEYLRDRRQGPWRFHLPGGGVDPLLGGVYEKGERVGALEQPVGEAPLVLPAPRPYPGLDEEERLALEAEVARFLERPAQRAELAAQLLARGREAMPAALERLARLDLADAEEVEAAFVLNYELLAPMHRGHAYRLAPGVEPADQAANRWARARWLALWESTRERPDFLEGLEPTEPGPRDSPALFELPFDPFEAPAAGPRATPASLANAIAADPRQRKKALRSHGGAGTEELLTAALDWILRHQSPDGRWSSSNFGMRCAAAGASEFCGGAGRAGYDVGVTALALLALMGDGSGPVSGPHAGPIQGGLDWLLTQEDGQTGFFGDPHAHDHVYGHALATLAFCRALRSGGSPELVAVLERCQGEILRRQLAAGGWRYDAREERPDSSITSWMLHALAALEGCGLDVPEAATPAALEWMTKVTEAETGAVGYDDAGGPSARVPGLNDDFGQVCETLTAASLFAHIAAGRTPRQAPWMEDQVELILAKPPTWGPKSADFYGWYHATYALFHWGKKPWKAWNAALKDALEAAQVDDVKSHAHGSFPTASAWGKHGGRVYTTAICALMLEVYLSGEPLLD